jgi:hypothetical protein
MFEFETKLRQYFCVNLHYGGISLENHVGYVRKMRR